MGNQSAAGRWGQNSRTTINMMYNFHRTELLTSLPMLIDFVSWDNYPTWHKEAESGNSDGYR